MAPMRTVYLSFIALSFYASNAVLGAAIGGHSTVDSYTLEISNKVLSPDGFNRSATVVNGQHPGPLIKANKGDSFRVKVVNSLTDNTMLRSTSVHWHGIFQHGTNWADGPVGVNQCPISPEHSFTYAFNAQGQAGTFWYHSHFGTQYCDGLRGPIVVYDPQDPYRHLYDVDDGKCTKDQTTIITLGDWYHIPSPSIKTIALSDATLINGIGRYPGGPDVDLAVVNVSPGTRYRFRLVSISCQPNYMFSIDGHQLTIIEADGQLTQPHTVDKIQIFAGQRYSFILQANQPVGNYWIRSLPDLGSGDLASGFSGGVNSAILRYKGAHKSDPTSSDNLAGVLLDESNLRGADYNFNFAIGFIPGIPATFTLDGNAFNIPSVPILLQILSGARRAQDLLPQGSVYPVKRNKTVEITVPGGFIGGPHPFHMHGHAFSVVRSASNGSVFNYDNPIQRDVVSPGPDGSSTTIRFVTDNTGPWFFHCHIDFHLQGGLALVFAEDVDDTAEDNPVPDAWTDLCPIYNALPAEATSVQFVDVEPTITVNPFTTPSSTIAQFTGGAPLATSNTSLVLSTSISLEPSTSTSTKSTSTSPKPTSTSPKPTSASIDLNPPSLPSSISLPLISELPTPSISVSLPVQPSA
ncbi:Cupredoxin [Cyathus striatus]|nr:Cupredoxin [Cyathus striatus]